MALDWLVRDHEPLFLNKGASRAELELRKMESLLSVVADEDKERLKRDISIAKAGIAGEKKIIFELESSHYPLVFIHDLCIEQDAGSSQIDFLVVTPYNVVIVECKNLVGDITIDATGAFTRTYGKGRYRRTEGVYSPVTQNRRHVEAIKAMVRSKFGKLVQVVQHYTLDDYYHSVVVLANEKSLLFVDSAPEDVRKQVIRADQLMDYIRALDKRFSRKNLRDSFKQEKAHAERWLAINKPTSSDVARRYKLDVKHQESNAPAPQVVMTAQPVIQNAAPKGAASQDTVPKDAASQDAAPSCPLCGAPMVLRTAKRGQHKGEKFWGCSMFGKTRCRGIVSCSE